MKARPSFRKITFGGFYVRNLGANLFGFVTVIVLNLVTPLKFFESHRDFLFAQGGWKAFFLFYPFVMLLIVMLQYRLQRPIATVNALLYGNAEVPAHLKERAKRRLVNLPFFIALVNFLIYLIVPGFVVLSFYHFWDLPLKTCLFIYFRTVMIGLIAGSLSFFLVEGHARETLIPALFPKGRLAALPGTIKVSVLRRIRILYGAGTLNPMILLVGTLLFIFLEGQGGQAPREDLIKEILLFTIVLCAIFVMVSLRLNFLVTRSILHPIEEMLRIVTDVRGGDFTRRIKVVSNDEIGVLADAGNDMVAGLAERERIRDTFGKYVPPEIRDQILNGRIPLDGEKAVATLLFSDLRSFTSYVEENSPGEVIRSMREYLTAMEGAIRRNKGLVLQFVGDEVEAVFGNPLYHEDHADRAVLAALEMREALRELNTKREKEGKSRFRHGIGIHTGPVLAGNTGSEDRLSYALFGDTVNMASRIADLTKSFDCDILMSKKTLETLNRSLPSKKEAPQTVRGFSKPVTVYRVL